MEDTPEAYVAKMVGVFREVRRILHDSGTLFLNLGDSFSSGGREGHGNVTSTKQRSNNAAAHVPRPDVQGVKPKDLIGIPWMVAFALRADGWYLRQWCPWVKRNPMPESVTDRPGTGCETVFLLSKRADYFFDMEAVKRPAATPEKTQKDDHAKGRFPKGTVPGQSQQSSRCGAYADRNFRSSDLWFDSVGMLLSDGGEMLGFDVPVNGYKGAHFATFPKALVEPMVLAGTSAKGVCPHCGAPWCRVVERKRVATRPGRDTKVTGDTLTDGNRDPERHVTSTQTVGWEPGCECPENEPIPGIVFDPFAGSGTTLAVAVDLGRRALGTELNPEYVRLIEKRMRNTTPDLFSEAT